MPVLAETIEIPCPDGDVRRGAETVGDADGAIVKTHETAAKVHDRAGETAVESTAGDRDCSSVCHVAHQSTMMARTVAAARDGTADGAVADGDIITDAARYASSKIFARTDG